MAFKRELTRKQQRKENRKQKKVKRHEYYTKRKNPDKLNPSSNESKSCPPNVKIHKEKNITKIDKKITLNKVLTTEQLRKKEQKQQKHIEKEMVKQRNKQLLESNVDEDRIIKQLEKKLGLNKRKSKSIPKGFSEDGLDYLLEICDPEAMKNIITAEASMETVNNQFEEDFALMTDKSSKKKLDSDVSNVSSASENERDVDESEENESVDEDDSNDDCEDFDEEQISDSSSISLNKKQKVKCETRKRSVINQGNNKKKIKLDNSDEGSTTNENSDYETNSEIECNNDNESTSDSEVDNDVNAIEVNKGCVKTCQDGTWEDIYGRERGIDGSVITKTNESKYVPPALRQKLNDSDDKKRLEKLLRLKRQLKGLLNRLAESNMHNVVNQIENLYMNNSRNDMNDSLTSLILESLVYEVITPERLLIEHIVLLTVLHANVGSEVGAHFLQQVANRFDSYISSHHEVENKLLDNIVIIIAQLYNFKIIDSKLIYEILKRLSNFNEKCVECILHILRNVGFSLRKDDPLTLKSIILELQKQASNIPEEESDNSRIKFMLDILLAIKNNNVKKIPNYDTTYSEHMKKIMKGFIRKGNYIMQLNISLEDLLKADQRGRWWVVGSAWAGNKMEETALNVTHPEEFSQNLLDLAKTQRMNTDTRKNIFCIIMSAEDYLDAFEKILRLSLKNQQERDIINVIIHCCLREKKYNPYYAYLAQKFCDYDRKFQMMIKYTVWDKLKALEEQSGNQISNLAKLLIHLFIEKGLAISILKIVQFSELDNVTLRFMRQLLIGILLHKEEDACISVFLKISKVDKLKMFCESLRLFIHHFLLRNLKSEGIPDDQKQLLENRAKMIEKILTSKQFRI